MDPLRFCFYWFNIFLWTAFLIFRANNLPLNGNDRQRQLLLLNNISSQHLQQNIYSYTNNSSGTGDGIIGGHQTDDAQNQFQSSISCGNLEFYVQLTFNKPFRGLVYAYKLYPPLTAMGTEVDTASEQPARYDHYFPVEILDSCTIRGNGASIIYLELSFLSECVEKLQPAAAAFYYPPVQSPPSTPPPVISNISGNESPSPDVSDRKSDTNPPNNNPPHVFNLDGFNFRRALNHQPISSHQLNISKDDTYQLSLYIQNDPNIEQKYDSKVTVQCSPQVTKNIILEQNSMNEFSRKVDHQHSLINPNGDRTILPQTNLTISSYDTINLINVSGLIESRMDMLRGRIPYLKIIEGNVELGDDVTLIIRTRQLEHYDSKISNCYAYDEGDVTRYQLTDQEGCPVDTSVMNAFKTLPNVGPESKVFYTTFAAFKFPGSQYLNIQCTLLVCRQVCPKPICSKPPKK